MKLRKFSLLLLFWAICFTTAFGQQKNTFNDTNTNGDWSDAANWSAGAPANGDTVTISNSVLANLVNINTSPYKLTVLSGAVIRITDTLLITDSLDVRGILRLGSDSLYVGGQTDITGTIDFESAGQAQFDGNISNSGTLTINNNRLYYAGNLDFTGFTTSGSSEIHMIGPIQSINTSVSVDSIIIKGGGVTTVDGVFDINNGIRIENNTTLTANSNMTVSGNWDLQEGSTFNPGTNVVDFDETGTSQNISSSTFYTVQFSGDGSLPYDLKTVSGSLDIQGNITINDNVDFDGGSYTHYVAGSWTFVTDGRFTSTGTVVFDMGLGNNRQINVNGTPTVSDTATARFYNLTIESDPIGRRLIIDGNDSLLVSNNLRIETNSFLRTDATAAIFAKNIHIGGRLEYYGETDYIELLNGGVFTFSNENGGYDGSIAYEAENDVTLPTYLTNINDLILNEPVIYTLSTNLTVEDDLNVGDQDGVEVTLLNGTNFNLTVYNDLIIGEFDTLRVNKYIHYNKAIDDGYISLVQPGATLFADSILIQSQDDLSFPQEVDIAATGAGAAIYVNEDIEISNPDGSESLIFYLEMSTSNITMLGGSNSLRLGDYTWISSATTDNFQTLVDSVESISLSTLSGISYIGTNTIATTYNHGTNRLNYENMYLENGTKTLTDTLIVNGNLMGYNNVIMADAGFPIYIAGDYGIENSTNYVSTNTIYFNGDNQVIANNRFNNVVFAGTGEKSSGAINKIVPLDGGYRTFNINFGTWDIDGDAVINADVTVTQNTSNITLAGDWTVNGTFDHDIYTLTLDGTGQQHLDGNFNNLTMTNSSDTVFAMADLTITGNFVWNANTTFADSGNTIYVEGNWTRNASGSDYVATGTVNFNGDVQVLDHNAGASVREFNNVIFSGAGAKTFADGGIIVNGDMTIGPSATFISNNAYTNVLYGDFTNNGIVTNGGIFSFEGGAQNIDGGTLRSVTIAGSSSTKTLTGNLIITLDLIINATNTLDAGADYDIEVRDDWTNNGTFVPRNGTVSFTSGTDQDFNGTTTFYNLIINKSADDFQLFSPLDVNNDLTITAGQLTASTYDINVGGSFINNSTITQSATSILTFDGSSGSHTIQAGTLTIAGDLIIDASGASYSVDEDATVNGALRVNNGTLNITSTSLTINDSTIVDAGTLNINKNGTLEADIDVQVNTTGFINIVGVEDSLATLTRSGGSNYTFNMDGSISAAYYNIQYTNNGVDLGVLATVDATNNFSYGNFSNGSGAQYINYVPETSSITNFDTLYNVSFNSGPASNITRTGGTDTLVMIDATGTLNGASNENDSPPNGDSDGYILWIINGYTWDGSTSNDWTDNTNWTPTGIPTSSDNVTIPGGTPNFPSVLPGDTARAANLTISSDSLSLSYNSVLYVSEDFIVGASGVFSTNTHTDSVHFRGVFNNSGTIDQGSSSMFVFEGTEGSSTITTNSVSLLNVTFDGVNKTWVLDDALDVNGNISILNGTLDVGAGNNAVTVAGDWVNNGTLEYQSGNVTFDGTDQNIGGTNNVFNNFIISGGVGDSKTLTANLDINGDLIATNENVELIDAGYTIYIFDDLTVQTGSILNLRATGTMVFNGYLTSTQDIDGVDTLNNVIFSGNPNRIDLNDKLRLKGDMTINFNSNRQFIAYTDTIEAIGESNTFSMIGAGQFEYRNRNFPKTFETYAFDDATQVEISPSSDGIDTIYTAGGTIEYGVLYTTGNPNERFVPDGHLKADQFLFGGSPDVDLNGQDLTVTNNLSVYSGFRSVASTLTYNLTVANRTLDIDIDSLGSLVVLSDGYTLDIDDTVRITNNFTVGSNTIVNIDGSNIEASSGSATMTLSANSSVFAQNDFPSGFNSYDFNVTSTFRYDGTTSQIVNTDVNYGNLQFDNGDTTMDSVRANLTILGDLWVTGDGSVAFGSDTIFLSGNYEVDDDNSGIDFESSTFYFNGSDQTYANDAGAQNATFYNLHLAGSGTKTEVGNDNLVVLNDLTVDDGVTLDLTNENLTVTGDLNNNGIIIQAAATAFFDGIAQNIDPGTNSYFNNIDFSNGSKTIVSNGLDIEADLTIGVGVTVDFGSLTHTIGDEFTNTGNGILTSGTFDFDGALGQIITTVATDTFNNLIFSNTGNKEILTGTSLFIIRGDFTVNDAANFDFNTVATEIGGSFVNNNTVVAFPTTFTLNSTNADNYQFKSNNAVMTDIIVNSNSSAVYQMSNESHDINGDIRIISGTLDLNAATVVFGNNTADSIVIGANGTLEVDSAATLSMDGATNIVTESGGTLRIVGSESSFASITTQNTVNDYFGAFILSGATIEAQNYNISNIDSMTVNNGATISSSNNFSNGIWSGGPASGGYLILDHTQAGDDTISNVQFGVGPSFNVARTTNDADGDTIVFSNYSGALGGEGFERDLADEIKWLAPSNITWDGSTSNDWYVGSNWVGDQVPNSTQSAIIPTGLGTYPQITSSLAQMSGLTLQAGATLVINGGNVEIGSDGLNNSGIIVFSSSDTMTVTGDFINNSGASFSPGSSSLVEIAGTVSSQSIDMTEGSFNNLSLTGNKTAILTTNLTINGTLTIGSSATLDASPSNYDIEISGNWVQNGTFSSRAAEVTFVGTNDTIFNGNFFDLNINTLGAVYTSGDLVVNDNFDLESGTFVLDGDMSILSNASAIANPPAAFIQTGTTFNDGGNTVTITGGMEVDGTYSDNTGYILFDLVTNGIVLFDGTTEVNNVRIQNENLGEYSQLNGDLTVKNFKLEIGDFYTQAFDLTGTDTLILSASTQMYVRRTLSGFSVIDGDASSEMQFDGSVSQTIPEGIYGRLDLDGSGTTKTLSGNIEVLGVLDINNNVTLDVEPTFNYQITLHDDWDGDNGGTFNSRAGTVEFIGNNTVSIGTQNNDTTNAFYNIIVNHTSSGTQVDINDPIRIINDLTITTGSLDFNNNQIYLGGNLSNSGTIINGGASTLYLVAANGSTKSITSGGFDFDNVTLNSLNSTYLLQDNAEFDDNLTITNGTLDLNGNTLRLGDGNDSHSITGTLTVDENATLEIFNSSDLTVNSGGLLNVIGTPGNIATVDNGGTGIYDMTINGTIAANYYIFEFMSTNGINITSSGAFDATNNLSNGTFTNGVSGGTLLRIENTQSDTISNVSFPSDPGGGAKNVTKSVAVAGNLFFEDATGDFSSEAYENDPNNLIDWPSNVTLTWDGSSGTDWHTAANWTASIGPAKVPDSSNVVTIPNVVNQPVISSSLARAKNVTIENTASLTLDGANILIEGDFDITGTLTVTNATDSIWLTGSWTRSGIYNNGSGAVILTADASKNINNGASSFYDLILNGSGSYALSSALNVSNDLTIENGTLNVSATDYDVNIGGNFTNNGTFNAQNGDVTFTASSGTKSIDIGASSFYDLTINGAAGIFQIVNNDISVTNDMDIVNGEFDLNGNNLLFGDGSGDLLTVDGTLTVDENASLQMGTGTALVVNSGGTLVVRGTDAGNPATVTRESTGSYSLTINGNVSAEYYIFEYMGSNGVVIGNSATVNTTYNFSNGIFRNGSSATQYLNVGTAWTGVQSDTIRDVTFNSGPTYNVSRTTGTDTLVFKDAQGALAGVAYENDNPDGGDGTGKIHWVYSSSFLTWVGGTDTDWKNAANWTPPALPDTSLNITIPDVSGASGNFPVIDSTASAKNLTINSGATLTVTTDSAFHINGSMSNDGTLTVTNGFSGTINVHNLWSNSGVFNSGNLGTVSMKGASGTFTITSGGDSFENLRIDSTGTFELVGTLDVDGDLTIDEGTLDVTSSDTRINVAGDWTNNASFVERSGSVYFDGNQQNIDAGGTGTTKDFNNIYIAGIGHKTLINNHAAVNGNVIFQNRKLITSNSSYLQFNDGAAFGNLSSSGHIEGPATIVWTTTTATKQFPIGKSDNDRKLAITLTNPNNAVIRAELFHGDAGGSIDGTLTAISDVRYYGLSLLSGSGTGTIGIKYSGDDKVGDGQLLGDELVVAQSTTSNGQYTSLGQSGVASSLVTSQSYDPTAGDYIILGSVATPLIDIALSGTPVDADPGQLTFMTTFDVSRQIGSSDATMTGITISNRVVSGSTDASWVDLVEVYVDTVDGDYSNGGFTLLGTSAITGVNGGSGTVNFSSSQTISTTTTYFHVYYRANVNAPDSATAGFQIASENDLLFSNTVSVQTAMPLQKATDVSLPVSLIDGSFTANKVKAGFEVTATTASEENVAFVIIQRTTSDKAVGELTNADWVTINKIESSYEYEAFGRDLPVTLDEIDLRDVQTLRYRIITEELNGHIDTDINGNILTIDDELLSAKDFELLQNYPNPFNPTTNIVFSLPYESRVTVEIFNLLGQKVLTLVNNQRLPAGKNTVKWSGVNQRGVKVSSGIYYYRMSSPDTKKRYVKKMILVK